MLTSEQTFFARNLSSGYLSHDFFFSAYRERLKTTDELWKTDGHSRWNRVLVKDISSWNDLLLFHFQFDRTATSTAYAVLSVANDGSLAESAVDPERRYAVQWDPLCQGNQRRTGDSKVPA